MQRHQEKQNTAKSEEILWIFDRPFRAVLGGGGQKRWLDRKGRVVARLWYVLTSKTGWRTAPAHRAAGAAVPDPGGVREGIGGGEGIICSTVQR